LSVNHISCRAQFGGYRFNFLAIGEAHQDFLRKRGELLCYWSCISLCHGGPVDYLTSIAARVRWKMGPEPTYLRAAHSLALRHRCLLGTCAQGPRRSASGFAMTKCATTLANANLMFPAVVFWPQVFGKEDHQTHQEHRYDELSHTTSLGPLACAVNPEATHFALGLSRFRAGATTATQGERMR